MATSPIRTLFLLLCLAWAAAHPHDYPPPHISAAPSPYHKPRASGRPAISPYPDPSSYGRVGPSVSSAPAASGNATVLDRDDLPFISGAVNEAENALRLALAVEYYIWRELVQEWNRQTRKERELSNTKYPAVRVTAAFIPFSKAFLEDEDEAVYIPEQINITSSKLLSTCPFVDCAVRLFVDTNRVVRWNHAGEATRRFTNSSAAPGFADVFDNRTAQWVLTKYDNTGFIFDIPFARATAADQPSGTPSPSPTPWGVPSFVNQSLLPDIGSAGSINEFGQFLTDNIEYWVWALQLNFSEEQNKEKNKTFTDDPGVRIDYTIIPYDDRLSSDSRIESEFPVISGVKDTIPTGDGYKQIYDLDSDYYDPNVDIERERKYRATDICTQSRCATRVYVQSEIKLRWRIINTALQRTRRQNSFKKVYSSNRSQYTVKKLGRKLYIVDIPFTRQITQQV